MGRARLHAGVVGEGAAALDRLLEFVPGRQALGELRAARLKTLAPQGNTARSGTSVRFYTL